MTKKLTCLFAFCLTLGLLLVACGGGADSNAGNSTANTGKAGSTASSGDKIGVAECDEYIAKYEACVNSKVPEAMRASVKASLDTARKMWKDAAATPQGRAGLAQACKTALEQTKQQLGSYGCTW
ncbi:MAG TPA: hypothetical protein VD968_06015 [Pyrinomonadaceae bacterium]|nr:hypothetical protein [Pyrinomonadaceae bacterium]